MSDLPSRRYTCTACGRKGRRNNSPSERLREPVCPRCEAAMAHFDIYADLVPFWQKRRFKNSPEFKKMLEVSAYYDQLVKHIKEK
jgi:hypothetical protein